MKGSNKASSLLRENNTLYNERIIFVSDEVGTVMVLTSLKMGSILFSFIFFIKEASLCQHYSGSRGRSKTPKQER